MNNANSKIRRARKICRVALKLAASHGTKMPAHYPGCPDHTCIVELLPLRIEILPNRYRAYMRKSPTMIGESTVDKAGWTVIEIRCHNERRACFNMGPRGLDEIGIYHFQPGYWEFEFGCDPDGDSVPILPTLFADDNEPAWQLFKNSGLYEWPPNLDGLGA
ncbi:MAG: hypothetical protein JY451_09240 [Erythrobacter sp.]|nr:MAG: hypothetical protein JY451_09240 [Erythrobacter sp.]